MNDFLNILNRYAPLISAISAIVIAVFSAMTWIVSRRIEKATKKRDKESSKLIFNLVCAILVAGKAVDEGKEESAVKLFLEQRKKLSKKFLKEFR